MTRERIELIRSSLISIQRELSTQTESTIIQTLNNNVNLLLENTHGLLNSEIIIDIRIIELFEQEVEAFMLEVEELLDGFVIVSTTTTTNNISSSITINNEDSDSDDSGFLGYRETIALDLLGHCE